MARPEVRYETDANGLLHAYIRCVMCMGSGRVCPTGRRHPGMTEDELDPEGRDCPDCGGGGGYEKVRQAEGWVWVK